jgi:hypothetical protein
VLRLEEGFEHAGRRIDAQVIEDDEVEDQERQQGADQAEQQRRGATGGLVAEGVGRSFDGSNIT